MISKIVVELWLLTFSLRPSPAAVVGKLVSGWDSQLENEENEGVRIKDT